MKIVIAPDSYKESLSAMDVATAIEQGFRHVLPDATYIKVPMADGGEGTVQSLIDASNGQLMTCTVTDPLGRPVDAFWGLMGDGKTAVIEMAAASGIHLVAPELRNPLLTTTFGTGELILAAAAHGVKKIIIGIGGSATNDGGIGMAQALGIQLLNAQGQALGFGGGALSELATIDTSGLHASLQGIELEVACDVTNPLCGPTGASAIFGPQKGATAEMVAQLDSNLSHYADIIEQQLGASVKESAGAGAAGGMGAALMGLLNAQLRPGVDIVIDAVQLTQIVQDADLVITGEGRIDSQTIHGKTPIGVARTAKRFNKPVIGIAGCLAPDCHGVYDHGIDAVFSVVSRSVSLAEALAEAAINVELMARNVAALYAMPSKK